MTTSTALDVAAPPAAQPPAVPQPPDRALNSTQQKNLQKIVEGDFLDLRERVDYEVKQQLNRRLKEIDGKYDDRKKIEAAKEKLRKAAEKAEETLRKAVEQIETTGVVVAKDHYDRQRGTYTAAYAVHTYSDTLKVEGKDKEVSAATAAADRLRQTSNLVINRREREALRGVLLSGVTTQSAADLINGMPKAEDIIGEVQAEIAVNNEDDLKALGYSQ